MGLFESEEPIFLSYEASKRLEDTFTQKPVSTPLEVPIRLIIHEAPRNDLPIILIGSLTIISLVGLFLVCLSKSRS